MYRQRMWRDGRAALVILGSLLLGAAAVSAAENADEIVARLGSTDVKISDFKDFVRGLDPRVRQQAAKDPQLLARLARVELARIAVLGEAKEKHWDEQPDVVSEIERARTQAIVTTYLASVTAPPAGYPSDAEIQAAYEQNRDRFMVPRQYHLAQIFVALAADADKKTEDAAQKRSAELVKKAKAKNADFADLARKNSDQSEAAKTGGDLGWLPETQLTPEVKSAVAGLGKNEISDAIRSAAGWHIVELIDTKPAGPQPLTEVRDSLVAGLRQKKAQDNEQAYLTDLLARKHAAVNEIGLGKILDAAK
jgi:parvulin-like peptidyl-prolyl isomerase